MGKEKPGIAFLFREIANLTGPLLLSHTWFVPKSFDAHAQSPFRISFSDVPCLSDLDPALRNTVITSPTSLGILSWDLGWVSLHLSALTNSDIEIWDVLAAVAGFGVLHLADDVHSIYYFAENNVLSVEEGGWGCGNEELGAVAVGASVL